MASFASDAVWPELPYPALRPTLETLQLWAQIVGKARLARTPWVNHGWHTTLYVSARGLTTGLIPHSALGFELEFALIAHALLVRVSDGGQGRIALAPGSVAGFYAELSATLATLGVVCEIDVHPNELADPTLDLSRKSGEAPMRHEGLDDAAATVYQGI